METEAPPLLLVKRANVTANSPNVNPPKVAVQWQSVGRLKLTQKEVIAFRSKTNITDIVVLKKSLKIFLNLPKGKLDDPKKLARDISEVRHWGNDDYQNFTDTSII